MFVSDQVNLFAQLSRELPREELLSEVNKELGYMLQLYGRREMRDGYMRLAADLLLVSRLEFRTKLQCEDYL